MSDDISGESWLIEWLDAVAAGESKMSQRIVSSIDKHGGLATATRLAARRGVHLVLLTDDTGRELVAASKHPFKVLC